MSFFCCRQLAKLGIVRGIHMYDTLICYLGQSATIKLTHVFMVAGWWVTLDFDSKYKILWSETRVHGPWGTYS